MACDVTIERFDKEKEPLTLTNVREDVTMDELLVSVAHQCNISPVVRTLFSFKQGSQWLSPSLPVGSVKKLDRNQSPVPVVLQLRLRHKMPDWRNMEKQSNLRTLDPKAFQYFYSQVSTDFKKGEIYKKKDQRKDLKWEIPLFYPGLRRPAKRSENENKDRDEEVKRIDGNMEVLVAIHMAIDIIDGAMDRKEISKKYKEYFPKNNYNPIEKYFVGYLKNNLENCVDRLLKAYPTDSMALKDSFLKHTEKYFPAYFCETFSARFDECGRVGDVTLVCLPPNLPVPSLPEDKPMTLVMVRSGDTESFTEIASIDQLCYIGLQEGRCIELSRKNGVPLYFSLHSEQDEEQLLGLLCGYYRLTEKWTFSLSTEVRFPTLEWLTVNKVHGPITKEFAVDKLRKTGFGKGLFLVHQSEDDHEKLHLQFCSRDGCRPEEVLLIQESGQFIIKTAKTLPAALCDRFSSIVDLVKALKTTPSFLELTDALHPSEFDRTPNLQLCRTDSQWKEDKLGSRSEFGREKFYINPGALSRLEQTLRRGRMCLVWRGEWRRKGENSKVVAIKQLCKSHRENHQNSFLEMSDRTLKWDDGSLVNVFGFCLPSKLSPPILVTEYFEYGPLNAYLSSNKPRLANVDLMEAAACLARALHYLSDNNMVHGEIRARNVFVCNHTERQFQVKLCEGSLDGPRTEDVHWLDFDQLQAALNSDILGTEIKPSMMGDVWSFGTTLWELFSFGESPLPGLSWREAAAQYRAGSRLRMPALLVTGQLAQLGGIILDCWRPDIGSRKLPQALMRDVNQLLFKVFNARRAHEYVTIDPAPASPRTLTPASSRRSVSFSSNSSMDLPTPPITNCGLVPMFNDISRKLLEAANNGAGSDFGSTSPLIPPSGSSRSNSIFNADGSVRTYETSLYSESNINIYSINSIYYLDDSSVDYNKEFPLGEGNFGVVYKGVRNKSDGDWEEVAIKEIKDTDTMSSQAHDDMEREVKLMKNLAHENIVKIRGVITNNSNTIIVMEFIREGSLDRYLQVNRHNIDYPKQLFGYAQNIADGMDYLTQNKIIHRDLAARNILVADQETVKISDFGLARVATNDCYVMNSSSNIPVRWEAIECLTHRKYSHKSDVWSFGVTLWEMFSFGATPALEGCQDFFSCFQRQQQDFRDWLSKLEDGIRLPQTELCTNFLYSRIMKTCWMKDPASRPNFRDLKFLLRQAELEVT